MNRIRTLLMAAVAATSLAACSDGTGPETVASVSVTPANPSITVGQTQQLSASATSSSGAAVTGLTVTWSSSAAAVATVSSSGLVQAIGAGQASITATVGGVAGSTIVTVMTAGQACTDPKTVSLAVGGTQAYTLSDCLLLPSGASGDRYRVSVIRPSQDAIASDAPEVTLSVLGFGVSAAPDVAASTRVEPSLSMVPGLSAGAMRQALRVSEATERFHTELRAREAEMIRRLGTSALLPRRPAAGTTAALVASAPSPAKLILDTSTTSTCETSDSAKKTAVLVYENDDVAFYQDSTQRADTAKVISASLAQKMTSYYTNYGKGVVEAYFGPPTDIDGNGKLILFATPIVEENVAAFVWSGDFFESDTTAENSCAASNEAEIMYFNTDVILAMEGGAYQALATVAHEAKHVVSLYNRIAASLRAGSAQYHPSWIEEGTAEIAGEMSSRTAWEANGGPAVGTKVSRTSFADTPGGITEYNYGVAINLARAVWFLSSQPNGLVIAPTGAAEGSSVYGSGWLFHRWLGDTYGNPSGTRQGDAAFFRALNDSLAPAGMAGITARTSQTFDALLDQFYTTVVLHGTGAPEGPRPFSTYDFVSSAEIFCNPNPLGVFPWPVTTTGTAGDCDSSPRVDEVSTPTASFSTKNYVGRIGPGGIRIHDLRSNGTGTGAQIRVEMTPPGRILVTRLR